MIWREKRMLLIVLGLLLAANTIFFFTYRVQYQSRLDALDARMEQVEGELQQARRGRMAAERTVQSYRKVESDVQEIFNEHWSTQALRLTTMIAEVKRLAKASGLIPASYSFAQSEVKKTSTETRVKALGASEVDVTFTVEGSYEQARRLINLLELSRQFIIIDGISLSTGDANLTLNLRLKTLFRDVQPDVATNRL